MAKQNGSAQKKPNIVFIMGDDIGWFNIGAYHRGMMAGRTPNLDRLAAEGMLFTDYYAEASCTAGRANFITGQLPIRTGLTTVGQAGATIGMPAAGADHRHGAQVAWATPPASSARTTSATSTSSCRPCTASTSSSATSITSTRWRTRRIRNYPPELKDKVGPRNMVHSLGDRQGRPDRAAALGQGRQAEDRGRRHALSRSGWRRWTTRSSTTRSSSSTRRRATTSRSSSGSTRRACTSSPTSPTSTRRCARRRTAGRSTRPAWRSSTTSSAR